MGFEGDGSHTYQLVKRWSRMLYVWSKCPTVPSLPPLLNSCLAQLRVQVKGQPSILINIESTRTHLSIGNQIHVQML